MQKKSKFIDRVFGCDNVPEDYSKYYVVLRSGRRVSDTNHVDYDSAYNEKCYWDGILHRHPDSTFMSIIECKNLNYINKILIPQL